MITKERLFGDLDRGVSKLTERWRGGSLPKSFPSKSWTFDPRIKDSLENLCRKGSISINSVHTRCIVKTSGFTRGVCKNRGFY